jgi:peptide/nickel transport system substrate-binding protein
MEKDMKKGLSKIAMALFAAGLAFNVSAADIKVAVASDATWTRRSSSPVRP